jgi:hypothetical protein
MNSSVVDPLFQNAAAIHDGVEFLVYEWLPGWSVRIRPRSEATSLNRYRDEKSGFL